MSLINITSSEKYTQMRHTYKLVKLVSEENTPAVRFWILFEERMLQKNENSDLQISWVPEYEI